jgi:basic membrane lipoprotein Med (substrate-binding protein (PBP1-ABC) superfamily)
MSKRLFWQVVSILVLASIMVTACTPAQVTTTAPQPEKVNPAPTEVPADTQPAPTEAPAAPVTVAEPTELKIAIVMSTTIEEPWNAVYVQALDRVAKEKPYGLTMTYDYSENVATTDAERVMNNYANSGKYGIMVYHSGQYADSSDVTRNKYPDILIGGSGSGFKPLGGNFVHSDVWVHECSYLLGIVAGSMTESNILGAVGAFPYPNVNLPINAFFAGAKSVNPEVKQVMTYLESWWDPAKAKESAAAQIAAGADYIYAERFGVFEAAKEAKVYAFGHSSDQHELAPDVVVSSALSRWDPTIKNMIDIWWDHQVNGTEYNVPTTTYIPTLEQGVCDIAPFYDFESKIPQEVKDAVTQARKDIESGAIKVPMIQDKVESTN